MCSDLVFKFITKLVNRAKDNNKFNPKMSSQSDETDSIKNRESALQDLQKLLRKSINDEVRVIECTYSSLLPVGENYGSLMLKVDAVIKGSKNLPEEKLNLVAKTLPSVEYIKSRIKTSVTFEKEMFVFEKLAPAYRQIEKDIFSNSVNDLFPKFYGGQVIKDKMDPDKAKESSVLLLENIKVQGYHNMNRKKGNSSINYTFLNILIQTVRNRGSYFIILKSFYLFTFLWSIRMTFTCKIKYVIFLQLEY